MRKLLLLVSMLGLVTGLFSQSPHGIDLKIDCAACHTSAGWQMVLDTARFNHNTNTNFALLGRHNDVECIKCHQSLVFTDAGLECISCHTDIHQQSVGTDCARCHTANNWLVDNITSLHQENGFPLVGRHATASCTDCHLSESALRFDRIGNDCASCHLDEYQATTSPNHPDAGYALTCADCHSADAPDWSATSISHDFFPLTEGHDISDCAQCHTGGSYTNLSPECITCHQDDYNATTNPNHSSLHFATDCISCHTTKPGWTPAQYNQHDAEFFPIYSGKHKGEWEKCTDCHINPANFSENSCIVCHKNPDTNNEHGGVSGYSYNDPACLACHPTGNADDAFDHNNTNFPLTGAHTTVDCNACHANGYQGTPMQCSACHTPDFNATTNPNHNTLGLSTDCAACHTTDPGWKPATFAVHNDYYVLKGAHAAIASDCAMCHNGDYNNTPNTCAGCHTTDYNQTTNPNHAAANFPTECISCHSETAWAPSTFNHDILYPFTGAHIPIANDCNACHHGNYSNTPNTCAGCHTPDFNATSNPNHNTLGLSTDCATCHTTAPGWSPASFGIHNTFYPLLGAHAPIANDCAACHNGDYNNTPNTCAGCHMPDYNQANDPNHVSLGFSTDCASCHTQNAWDPSTFNHDGQYFPIFSGEHDGEWDKCTDCHTNPNNYAEYSCTVCHTNPETNNEHNGVGGYTYSSPACLACHPTGNTNNVFNHNTSAFPLTGAHATTDCAGCHATGYQGTTTVCSGCHMTDFNQSANPNHTMLGLSTDCASCHSTEPGWAPASFGVHNNYYQLNGAHAAIANDCAGCHNGNYSVTPNTCAGCHTPDYNQTSNPNHLAGNYPTDCASCHSENAWAPSTFNHNSFYPLTGAHAAVANDCNICHQGNYTNTPNTCAGCHTPDYNQSANPNHQSLGLSTDCESCHTTAPGWSPAAFAIHNNYYQLNGAHANIANDCAACHNGNYNTTPNTCAGCHTPDYNQTTNPNHTLLQFSTDCASCHSETAWMPSTFNHDGQYFPIYSGEHNGEWNTCTDCHTNPNNWAEFTCISCHTNPETNNDHNGVSGYSYNNSACLACHPTGSGDNIFNHNTTSFPLTGGHNNVDCLSCHAGGFQGTSSACVDCHQPEYNQSANPNHPALGLSTDCATCHTTDPGWSPATFGIHNNYYQLNGAHAAIANDCAACHNGNYTTTPNTCAGCHTPDYNQTTNPNHLAAAYPTDCALCHTENAWAPSTFDHNAFYPFTGAHIAIANDCNACHQGNYTNTPNTCAGCHTPDYNQSANPNHVALNIPTDCAMCHTTDPGWSPATFGIHNNYYQLNGAHAAIANDCAACHNGNYTTTPNTCAGCHTPDYNATTNPNHLAAGYPTDCAACHSENAWAPSTFDHNTIYPFTGAHIAIANDCNACHQGNYTNTPNTCAGCHTPDYNTSTNPNHVALNIPTDCAMCHTTDPGWSPATFGIHNNYYQLNGAHAAIANDCAACHNGNYSTTPNTCAGCHTPDYNQTTNPNHVTSGFPTDCALCHTENTWAPSTFDHNTIYPFTGAHIAIANDCNACHQGNYTNTPNTCAGCHTPDYNQSTNPNHVALNIPTDCAMCHTTDPGWSPATFAIHNNYYPLNGAHAAIANDCAACHNGNYTTTPNTCAGCHTPDYNQTTNPNHITSGFPTDCALCHTESAWVPSNFDHNAIYPFTGAHIAIANDCNACHQGNYTNTPNTCAGCHTPDYNQSTNPNHVALNIPTDCAMCHTTEPGWSPATFAIHNNYYPLNGAHAAIADDCVACHNGNYNNTPNTCAGCHTPDYNQTTNPNHIVAQFPTNCTICHDENAWSPTTFDHNVIYPFTGAHIPIANDCNACHQGNYTNTPNTCAGCHTPDYNQSTNPSHLSLSLPTDCAMCHTTDPDWEPATFPIHNSFWVLNGQHAAIADDCAACHNGNYNNTPNTCVGCHQSDYNQTTNPNHIAAGFPTNCTICHDENGWIPSTFDHNAIYPFTGAHLAIANDCDACHNGNYTNTPNTCAGCHTPDYNTSTNPNHLTLSLPTDCAMCHTTEPDWYPATFPIHNSFWALNGAHAAIANDCAACHNGNYNNTPNTCYGCHQADYNSANNPNHIQAGFPTTCASCHTENAWTPSTWDHDNLYFPIFSGQHDGEWDQCTDCHTTPGNFTVFSCIICHDNQSELANDHQGISGYSYNSNACYNCHPNGEAD